MRIEIYKPKHKSKWLEDKRDAILLLISERKNTFFKKKTPMEIILKLFRNDIDLNEFDQILYNLDIYPSYDSTLKIRKYIIKFRFIVLLINTTRIIIYPQNIPSKILSNILRQSLSP